MKEILKLLLISLVCMGLFLLLAFFLAYLPTYQNIHINIGIETLLISMVVILPIMFLVIFSTLGYKTSSGVKKSDFVNIFESADKIIATDLGTEIVLNKWNAYELTISILKIKKAPLGFGVNFQYPFPARIIETEHFYLIDHRLQNVLNVAIAVLIISPILSIITNIPQFTLYMGIGSIIMVAVSLYFSIATGLSKIELINKSWITYNNKNGHRINLVGNIPENTSLSLSENPFFKTGSFSIPFDTSFYTI